MSEFVPIWSILSPLLSILLLMYYKYYFTTAFDVTFYDRDACPSCYGESLCDEIFKDDTVVEMDHNDWFSLFDVRNIHYGLFRDNPVVLKKLAHTKEFEQFDNELRKIRNQTEIQSVGMLPDLKMVLKYYNYDMYKFIKGEQQLFLASEPLICDNKGEISNYLLKQFKLRNPSSIAEHFVTSLVLNPELILFTVSFFNFTINLSVSYLLFRKIQIIFRLIKETGKCYVININEYRPIGSI